MIIQALKEYYDRKADDPESDIPKKGWECKEIKYIIVLTPSGSVHNLKNMQEGSGKDKSVQKYIVPQSEKRTIKPKSNLLWDNAEYVLGMDKDGNQADGEKHELFRQKLEDMLDDVDDDGLRAVKKFLALPFEEKIKQLKEKNSAQFENLRNDGSSVNITFQLKGEIEPVFRSEAVKKRIDEKANPHDSAKKGNDEKANTGQKESNDKLGICLITGQEEPIANLHPAIKGVYNGQPSGTNIVGFNLPAFCSFGKKQGGNAPIGESTTFAYTTALNTLLAKDSSNNLQVGEATVVFWSAKESAFEKNFKPLLGNIDKDDDPNKGIEAVKALYRSVDAGKMTQEDEDEKNICFYVLGLSPNSARLSIRFWINSPIEDMKKNIIQHFEDIKIVRPAYMERDFIPLFKLLVSVAAQEDAKNIPPTIEGDLMTAILEGRPYPRTLFNCAIERTRRESCDNSKSGSKNKRKKSKVSWERASILKAYLNRKLRLSKNSDNNLDNTNNQSQPLTETEIQMSLDIENKNVGYCLGRLFRTLERIQEEANGNATICDRFYGAASGTPVTVFPNLLRLMTHHIAKLKPEKPGFVINMKKLTREILDKIGDFPATLSMEDQGRFALGYYHQENVFFTKKTDSNNTPNTDSDTEEQSK